MQEATNLPWNIHFTKRERRQGTQLFVYKNKSQILYSKMQNSNDFIKDQV